MRRQFGGCDGGDYVWLHLLCGCCGCWCGGVRCGGGGGGGGGGGDDDDGDDDVGGGGEDEGDAEEEDDQIIEEVKVRQQEFDW